MFFLSEIYKRIVEKLPTAIVLFDKDGKVKLTNQAFRDNFPQGVTWTKEGGMSEVCRGKNNATQFSLFYDSVVNQDVSAGEVTVSAELDGERFEISLFLRGIKLNKKYCLGILENTYDRELAKELTGAHDIQQRLLPSGKEAGGVPYNYMYIPCREIGGDLPDVYEMDLGGRTMDTFGVIADVSGKGIAAGMLSSFVKAGFDRTEPSPAKAIAKLNVKFQELNQDERAYITVAAVRIDSDHQKICYSVAGHNAPILLKGAYGVSEIEMSAPPVSNWFENYSYEDRELDYDKGDILVLLTDGVTESRNAQGEQFGIERVENVLLASSTAQQFIEALRAELATFCGTFDDDITAIAFDL